ncbi:class II glutamine amidotransferase [uncultured Microscilla sp.]|uniref:class II glutamine amidotransferase n=1 Tax=uncultured Microscilla sp. TaxID=432653 RepID=UPI0026029EB4|nr:class II glutamine amidotransferase [uncultured Microscilla sp.]
MCGIALVRLKKPFEYYIEKYGTPAYGARKMYLLMHKQHNRGQNGVGVACTKLDMPAGQQYMYRYRSVKDQPIEDIFGKVNEKFRSYAKKSPKKQKDLKWLKENVPFAAEVLMGHLRYGTHGGNRKDNCHPFLRQNNWRTRNLTLAGNFNLTNVDELFNKLIELGQHPKEKVDTVLVMEKIGHFLDEVNQEIFDQHKQDYSNADISKIIEEKLDIRRVLERACRDFDGGYTMAGIIGHGASFIARDPHGIRPAYYYADDEVVVAASEKPAIKTAFNVDYDQIQEVPPAHALIIDKKGEHTIEQFIEPKPQKSCTFERIYFSRGSDPEIYTERKKLGALLVPQVLKAIDYDLENTVFSFIPNTSETSFLGLMQGMEKYLGEYRRKKIIEDKVTDPAALEKILSLVPRVEKLAIKDAKLRTFIADDAHRDDLVAHVYDTTYEVVKKGVDTLVLIDDSIVRGTTLEKSILRILDKLSPKKIIIVSSAPQIRFPDCYGIDMSKMGAFVAFRAVTALLKERNKENLMDEVFDKINYKIYNGEDHEDNFVKELYAPFTDEEVSKKIAEIVRSHDIKAEVEVIYQTVENLHKACPKHEGDWYFTGNYPTHGGNRVVNKSFVNYMKGSLERAY